MTLFYVWWLHSSYPPTFFLLRLGKSFDIEIYEGGGGTIAWFVHHQIMNNRIPAWLLLDDFIDLLPCHFFAPGVEVEAGRKQSVEKTITDDKSHSTHNDLVSPPSFVSTAFFNDLISMRRRWQGRGTILCAIACTNWLFFSPSLRTTIERCTMLSRQLVALFV